MSSVTEKSPKESSWGNSAKITEIKAHCFAPQWYDVFMIFIVISQLGYYLYQNFIAIPLKSSRKDESFGINIINLGQGVKEL